MDAIIYARFSSGTQAKGDSIPRQLRTCKSFVEAKGWALRTEPLIDEGRSGYKGEHRAKGGAFAAFEREAADQLHVGKVLVVERLDRLSRQGHNETYDLIRALTKNGVGIATVEGDRLYQAYGEIEFGQMIELLVRLQMNHEESAKKADHSRAKWQARRALMISTKKPVTALCPAWLRLNEDRSRYEVFDDRDATVRLIFDMADEGMGSHRIARALNDRSIAPWPRFANRTPKAWSRGTIVRMLTDISVTGDHQPMRNDGDKRVPEGDPIRGYYPRVIEPDQFARVSKAANARKGVRGNKGEVSNLVAGLAFCQMCGAKMAYRLSRGAGHVRIRNGVKLAPTKSASASLLCPTGMDHGCSNRRSIAYISLEKGLIDAALHYAVDEGTFARRDEVARLDIQIADRERDRQIAHSRAVFLWDQADSAMAAQMAAEKESEAQALVVEVKALREAREVAAGRASAAAHLSRLNALRDMLRSTDREERIKARLTIAQGFRAVIDRIECDPDGRSTVRFVGDTRIMIVRSARGRRSPIVSDYDLLHRGRRHDRDDEQFISYVERIKKLDQAH